MSEYATTWEPRGRRHRAHYLQLEPDQALRRCYHLLTEGHPFVVEIDPTLPGMKDVVVVSQGAEFVERPEFTYIRKRGLDYDEAAQYVTNLIRAELSFSVTPEVIPSTQRREWLVLVELRKR